MTSLSKRTILLLIGMTLSCGLLGLVSGCGRDAAAIEAEEPQRDPNQELADAHAVAKDAIEMFNVAGGNHRLKLAQLKVQMGLDAIEEIKELEELTPEREVELGIIRVDLLLLGKRAGGDEYEQQMLDFANELAETDPHGKVAAYVYIKSFEQRYLSTENASLVTGGTDELKQYVAIFGADEQAENLFVEYGQRMQIGQRLDEAVACYQEAIVHFPNNTFFPGELARINQYYARLAKASEFHKQAYRALKKKLGNNERAVFVIASWSDTDGNGFGDLDYHVLDDIEGVSKFASHLPPGTVWKMMRAFPKTPKGRSQAGQVRSKLKRERKVSWDHKLTKTFSELEELAWKVEDGR